ncbi:kinase-like domain-containing protein [Cercophora newfieldiana]|uniref:Kinase-like domain-containing protein n=1 Tax=Cercophora newfieldiana TaxID=92897 RepID=A0AA39XXR0_9PEZI|nr:kinase-like domain-containing protein [Cercophora newfieldiana]
MASLPGGRSTRSWAEVICGEPSSIRAISSVNSEGDAPNTSASRTYRKIFAVLVQMNNVGAIFDFVREEVSDEDLPLMQYIPPVQTPDALLQLRRKNDATNPVRCFVGWRNYLVRAFFGDQWAMVSPFFARGEHRNVRHYQLADGDILPFTYDSRDESGPNGQGILERGGFGEVFKVQIHHDHHGFEGKGNFRSRRNCFFAVKKLYSTHEAEWKSEIEILKRFSANTNPHLISLLATYEKSGHVHLIFYWADADLQKFWKNVMSTPKPGPTTARWVARQCLGIASGIVEIHRHLTQSSKEGEEHGAEGVKNDSLYGRHGDIKPRNILWFKDGPDPDGMGTLVITDFGIAEMNSKNSRSGKPNRYIKFSPTYCAPEAHVPGGEIRQSYDIWTLGCLYLEFITWLLGGWKLVFEFAQLRQTAERASSSTEAKLDRFFELEIGEDNNVIGARVKAEVTEFIKRLHSHPNCTDFVHDFLKLINDELLIIETRDNPRFTSQQLYTELFKMGKKMQESEFYGANPTPEGSWDGTEQNVGDGTNNTGEAATSTICSPKFSTRATL